VKHSQGRTFVICDGGINHLGIRQMQYRSHPPDLRLVSPTPYGEVSSYTVVGPTCTPIDITHPDVKGSAPSVGDLVAIQSCGAYTSSFSPSHFCGQSWATEVFVFQDGNHRIVRERAESKMACGAGYVDPRGGWTTPNGSS
jgi:diaminopimelate decarboxylase